jgi:hypothetical protein
MGKVYLKNLPWLIIVLLLAMSVLVPLEASAQSIKLNSIFSKLSKEAELQGKNFKSGFHSSKSLEVEGEKVSKRRMAIIQPILNNPEKLYFLSQMAHRKVIEMTQPSYKYVGQASDVVYDYWSELQLDCLMEISKHRSKMTDCYMAKIIQGNLSRPAFRMTARDLMGKKTFDRLSKLKLQ